MWLEIKKNIVNVPLKKKIQKALGILCKRIDTLISRWLAWSSCTNGEMFLLCKAKLYVSNFRLTISWHPNGCLATCGSFGYNRSVTMATGLIILDNLTAKAKDVKKKIFLHQRSKFMKSPFKLFMRVFLWEHNDFMSYWLGIIPQFLLY